MTTRGAHYDANEIIEVLEPCYKRFLHLIFCERHREL